MSKNIYSDIIPKHKLNDDNYYQDEKYVSNSMLSLVEKNSRKLFNHKLEEEIESDALLFGSVFHCMILEPSEYTKRYTVSPKVDKRTKLGKETYIKFIEEVEKTGVIPYPMKFQEPLDKMWENLRSVGGNSSAMDILGKEDNSYEDIVVWKNKRTNINCKGKLDIVNHKHKFIADLKTTGDASLHGFKKSIRNFKYHKQAAFYLDALGYSDYYIIAVEKTAPYGIGVYRIGDDLVQEGRDLYNKQLDIYSSMMENGTDYDYNYEKIVTINSL